MLPGQGDQRVADNGVAVGMMVAVQVSRQATGELEKTIELRPRLHEHFIENGMNELLRFRGAIPGGVRQAGQALPG